jgi:phosphoribosylglycinamide formyltransferase 2
MRGDRQRVILEEFINFDYEITLLTIRQKLGETLFCAPIGHRQERGDYQESWQPVDMNPQLLADAQRMAHRVTANLGGAGIFGVEMFITKDEVIFSELSPRPHDTGMVTLISQNLSEFDLHVRAILGFPIPGIEIYGPSASSVVLADRQADSVFYEGIDKAMAVHGVDVRIFGKSRSRPYRRMAVCLARAESLDEARKNARRASELVQVRYVD